MTDDRTALVQALADAPADLAVRGVLADWLWEHDEDQLAEQLASDSRLMLFPLRDKVPTIYVCHSSVHERSRRIGSVTLKDHHLCVVCWVRTETLYSIWGAWHCKQCVIHGTELNLIPTPMMCPVCVVPAENEQPRLPVPGCPRCRGFGRVLWPARVTAAMVDAFRVKATALARVDQLADEEGE